MISDVIIDKGVCLHTVFIHRRRKYLIQGILTPSALLSGGLPVIRMSETTVVYEKQGPGGRQGEVCRVNEGEFVFSELSMQPVKPMSSC